MVSASAYEKQQETITLLSALGEKYGLTTGFNYVGLIKLSQDLRVELESIVRILGGLQGVDPEQGKKIRYLYAIKMGKVHIEVPKPFLEPPKPPELEIRKCSTLTALSGLEHGTTLYMASNHRDVLPYFIEHENYDGAMNPVRVWIDDWATNSFRKKDKAMGLVIAPELSISTHHQNDCPEARRYEYELIDNYTEEIKYGIKYTQGKIVWSKGNLPLQDIVSILKNIGKWEK